MEELIKMDCLKMRIQVLFIFSYEKIAQIAVTKSILSLRLLFVRLKRLTTGLH